MQYRLVYILCTKGENKEWVPFNDGGEFMNRAAAREYLDELTDSITEDVYLLRKEVAFFYDEKIFDNTNK